MEKIRKFGQISNQLTRRSRMSRLMRIALFPSIAIFVSGLMGSPAAQAETYTFSTLHSFNYNDGANTQAGLVQGANGELYGTTLVGGANAGHEDADGTVFEITTAGKLTTLHSFSGPDGDASTAPLVKASNGNFYGTTPEGGTGTGCGSLGCGTVFEITPSGKLTTLHSFDGPDGSYPYAGLVQGTNGALYGTTFSGGRYGVGTIFEISLSGKLTTLHSFNGNDDGMDGALTYSALVQGANGNFYGTAYAGGHYGMGAVFEVTPSGTLTILHSFDNSDGAYPRAGLVKGSNGDFYGTTNMGGFYNGGNNGSGTVFEMTRTGALTTLHVFGGTGDGAYPYATLVQASNGYLYGTTYEGGDYNNGTIFEVTPDDLLLILVSFDISKGDGGWPYSPLVIDSNGNLYGTTSGGGAYSAGTVFSLTGEK